MTWDCGCGQVGRVLQVANLRPDPAPPVLEPEPEPPRPPDFPVPDGETFTLEETLSGSWAPEVGGAPEDPEPDQGPVPGVASPSASAVVGLMESLRDAWTGEDSTDRAAAAAGVPRDLLESLDAAADQVARETRTPRRRS